MLKGCQRKMIVINNTGSRYFDTAYFVLRCDLPQGCAKSDMLAEAAKMIEACSVTTALEREKKKSPRIGRTVVAVFAAAALLLGIAGVLFGISLL